MPTIRSVRPLEWEPFTEYERRMRGIWITPTNISFNESAYGNAIWVLSEAPQEPTPPKVERVKKTPDKMSADVAAFLEWKYNRGLVSSLLYKRYREKWGEYRSIKIHEDFKKWREAKEEVAQLDTWYYNFSRLPNENGKFPISYTTMDHRGRRILKIDGVVAMDWKIVKPWSHWDYTICEDTEGKYTRNFTVVRFRDNEKCYYDVSTIATIYYGWKHYEKEYGLSQGLRQCTECGAWYNSRTTAWCSCSIADLDGYHSTNEEVFILWAENADIRIWIEIEKSKQQTSENILKMKKAKWRCERDSSVWGGEYITPILPLCNIDNTIDWITSTGQGILELPVDSRCGGHIHISKKDTTAEDLYESIKWWRPLLWALYPERATSSYANKDNGATSHSVDVGLRRRTVEVRIFPWLDSERKLRFRLSLLKYIVQNPMPEVAGSLEKLLGCAELQNILSIAYGKNILRMKKFFSRLKEFYSVDTGGEIDTRINTIADTIIVGKWAVMPAESSEEPTI